MSRCTCPPDPYSCCDRCDPRIDHHEYQLVYGPEFDGRIADQEAGRVEQGIWAGLGES